MKQRQWDIRNFLEFGTDLNFAVSIYGREFKRNWSRFDRFDNPDLNIDDIIRNPIGPNRDFECIKGRNRFPVGGRLDELVIANNDRSYKSLGLDLKLDAQLFEQGLSKISLEAGLRLHRDQIQQAHTEDLFSMQQGRLVATNNDRRQTKTNIDQSEALSAWGQLKLEWQQTIQPGIRVEAIRSIRNDLSDKDDDSRRQDQVLCPV